MIDVDIRSPLSPLGQKEPQRGHKIREAPPGWRKKKRESSSFRI